MCIWTCFYRKIWEIMTVYIDAKELIEWSQIQRLTYDSYGNTVIFWNDIRSRR